MPNRLAQKPEVPQMVPPVPGVLHQRLVEGARSLVARVEEGALPLRLTQVLQQDNPARVQALKQG